MLPAMEQAYKEGGQPELSGNGERGRDDGEMT